MPSKISFLPRLIDTLSVMHLVVTISLRIIVDAVIRHCSPSRFPVSIMHGLVEGVHNRARLYLAAVLGRHFSLGLPYPFLAIGFSQREALRDPEVERVKLLHQWNRTPLV